MNIDTYLQSLPRHKRWFFQTACKVLYPTVFSAIGFAYIAIPTQLQITIRRSLPYIARKHFLMLYGTDTWLLILLMITVFCAIWGSVGGHMSLAFFNKRYQVILDENERLKQDRDSKTINCYQLFSSYLYSHFRDLKLGTSERVSLYKLDMDMFSCIGRYSDNELFRSIHNRIYPKNQGCIAQTWKLGEFQDNQAPDPNVNLEEWEKYNIEKFSFSKNEISRIRMKSRSFYGVRLKNSQHVTVAVIIIESLDSEGLSFVKIKRLLTKFEQMKICTLIESLESHIPSLENAKLEGF